MGRCPEDGQAVLFEATGDQACDLFCDLRTDTWVCRLAVVCADVHAIYTPELSPDLTPLAADVSRQFGEAYYELVCDEPTAMVWRSGELWLTRIPGGRRGRQLRRQIFVNSNAQAEGQLWQHVHDFIWGDFGEAEFLLEE